MNCYAHFELIIMEAIILEISFASLINSFIFSLSVFMVSLIRHNQYFVSFADFSAIIQKRTQSFLLLPAFPSTIFAPIEVAALINCSNKDRYTYSHS